MLIAIQKNCAMVMVMVTKKSLRKTTNTVPNNDIPNDIFVEILLRLSAKSLLRLRWTCKYWFDLIAKDHAFIRMHLLRSPTHEEFFSIISPSVLSISHGISDCHKIFQCYVGYNNVTRVGHVSSEVSIDVPYEHPTIMGSSYGIILVYKSTSEKLCIWNPCTKEYRVLPHPLPPTKVVFTEENDNYSYGPYGFGYDHITDDYKVITIIYYYVLGDLRSDVQVYTLGTNSWRRVGPNPFRLRGHYKREGMLAKGALYWIDSVNKDVISFDIGKEKFQNVSKLPKLSYHDDIWHKVRIQVFEGSLCLRLEIKNQKNYHVEMWLMKDYAVDNKNEYVWTKLVTIPNLCDRHLRIKPLRFTKNGEILMVTNDKDLVLYDPRNNKYKTLHRICKEDNHYVEEVYTETLVSLRSGTYTDQERRNKSERMAWRYIYFWFCLLFTCFVVLFAIEPSRFIFSYVITIANVMFGSSTSSSNEVLAKDS